MKDGEPVEHGSGENKAMPDGVVQIVVADKKGDTAGVANTTQDQEADGTLWKDRNEFGKADHAGPTHSQIHGEREMTLVFPCVKKGLHKHATDATRPNKGQQPNGPKCMTPKRNSQKGRIRPRNQNVNGTLVHDGKHVFRRSKGKKGMVQSGRHVQAQ
eukprot:scaffold69257_cov59-Attheya_sp.AAC.2